MIAAGLLAVFLLSLPALAQSPCDRRDSVIDLLEQKYREAPVAAGVTHQGSLVEVLTDEKSGTWTIIVTSPQGTTCLIFSGDGWRRLHQIAEEPEA